MSAWEGSEWQMQQEKAKAKREADLAKIQSENPWLTRQQCEQWQWQREEEARARAAAKCCPCHGRSPGVVQDWSRSRDGHMLCICKCDCHGRRPRGE